MAYSCQVYGIVLPSHLQYKTTNFSKQIFCQNKWQKTALLKKQIKKSSYI